MKTAHIVYHNDWDGKMSGAIMYQYIREARPDIEKYELYEVDYTMELDGMFRHLKKGDIITFTDYSFSKESNLEVLFMLVLSGYEVIWIDHHKTSVDVVSKVRDIHGVRFMDLNRFAMNYDFSICVDTSHCATWLAWVWAYTKLYREVPSERKIPKLIKYVNSYDTFKHDMESTEECHYGVMSYKYEPNTIFKKIFNAKSALSVFDGSKESLACMDHFINNMITSGRAIKKYVDRRNESERAQLGFEFSIVDIPNNRVYSCYAMNIHSNSSAFGSKYDIYDIVCPFILIGGKQWKYSLYSSKENVDCAALAETIGDTIGLGGGGHKGAAGFQTSKNILESHCRIIISRTLFNKPKVCVVGKM
jgi:oligoribonuclease NrnB/cAMP/cGMP phosphodiesterase (DHH superfamily)